MERKILFTRKDTKVAKGMAIVLMLIHHLWTFPDRLPNGNLAMTGPLTTMSINGVPILIAFGRFGKICVSIFMFFVGYGLYKQYISGRLNLAKRITSIYFSYWKIFILFIPIAFIFFGNQEALTRYSDLYRHFDLQTFILNFWGINVTAYNGEWWFVMAFVIACLVGYIYIVLTKNINDLTIEMGLVFLLNLFVINFLPELVQLPVFESLKGEIYYEKFFNQTGIMTLFSGITFAKYNVLDQLMSKLAQIKNWGKWLLSIGGVLSAIYLLNFSGFEFYYFVLTPVLVALLVSVINTSKILTTVFIFLGQHSTNMWLVHSFFCYRFSIFVKLVFISRNPIINLLVLILLSLGTSIAIDYFYNKIEKLKDKYHLRIMID
ncbi:acyltransferase family protein [Vagococcus zengguangii]|uniref:acyltransferase family protein n=1 Tax=Vagococcus zengguangii TaxID=2571750 RepID=UPI00143E0AC5|nr:acyltransferase family protein [Vagococcus zengguangii]